MDKKAKVLFIIIALAVVSYFLITGLSQKEALNDQTIKSNSDLNQAQDQLNSVDVNGVDTGLNQLNTEASGF